MFLQPPRKESDGQIHASDREANSRKHFTASYTGRQWTNSDSGNP